MSPQNLLQNLRDYKTDNNLLLLKTEMNAGHGGKSGRDGAIEEIAIDYAFALKICKKIRLTSFKLCGDFVPTEFLIHIIFLAMLRSK